MVAQRIVQPRNDLDIQAVRAAVRAGRPAPGSSLRTTHALTVAGGPTSSRNRPFRIPTVNNEPPGSRVRPKVLSAPLTRGETPRGESRCRLRSPPVDRIRRRSRN